MPESRTERRAYDLVADGFGAGINGPFVIAVDLDGQGAGRAGGRDLGARRHSAMRSCRPRCRRRDAARVNAGVGVASIVAFPSTTPAGRRHLRDGRAPACRRVPGGARRQRAPAPTSAVRPPRSATSRSGSPTACPWFIAAVVLLSFLLLMIVFRSILVPLKAAILNLLSIGAAYGVLVMVFQWGWGEGPDRPRDAPCPSSRSSRCSCSRSCSGCRWTTRCSCSHGSGRSTSRPATTTKR